MAVNPYTTDTSPEAEAIQLECFERMSPQERSQKCFALSNQLRLMAFEAIRRDSPGISENEVRLRFIETAYGEELASEVREWLEKRNASRA